MPHVILKRVWDYCSYNKYFLAFIFVLLFISSLIQNYVRVNGNYTDWLLLQTLVFISVSGYGMSITKSRINHGIRLPKIIIKDVIVLGIKSTIIISIYLFIQAVILQSFCYSLNFPVFDLKTMLLNWSDMLHMLFHHDPTYAVLFIVLGSILFYITSFFAEIALAILADTNSMFAALNLLSIKRSIDVLGWGNYAKEYTLIIFAIVFLSYLVSLNIPFTFLDSIVDMILSFLIFATEYLGIGAVYCRIKDLESVASWSFSFIFFSIYNNIKYRWKSNY